MNTVKRFIIAGVCVFLLALPLTTFGLVPLVNSLSPDNEEVHVKVDASLTLTFNEGVQKGIGDITIYESGGTVFEAIDVTSTAVTVNGPQVTINSTADFNEGITYYVLIADTAIENYNNETFAGISDQATWTFTVRPSLNTVEGRMVNMFQQNIDDPWPSIDDPNFAPGVFSYSLACLYLNQNVEFANQFIFDFYTNNPIPPKTNNSRDEYNGYFWQHIMWRIYFDPTTSSRLTTATKEIIEDNMWVWLATRSKLSEAAQDEWIIHDSENHDAMQKGSHLMCLTALSNSARYGTNMVLNDGGTIDQHKTAWTSFYMRYFRARALEGINVEIACAQYARYTLGAYYNILDFSESADLRALVTKFLDLYWADTVSDWTSSGVRGGSQTRVYRQRSVLKQGTQYAFHPLLYGHGWHDRADTVRHYVMIPAISSYQMPDILTAIATDPARPNYLYTSRRFGLGGNWDNNMNYTVDFENGNSNLLRETWVTPDYSMGTLTLDMNKNYIALIDQNRISGVVFASGVNDRIMVYGNGGSDPEKSFADSIGVTRENCMIVQRDKNGTTNNANMQLFISQNAWNNRVEADGWFFTQLGDAYCALRPAGGGYTTAGTGSGFYMTTNDLWAPIIIQMGQAGDYADFADFQASVVANNLTYSGGTMRYTSEAGDTFELYPNSKTTPKVNGTTVNLNPIKTYDSPYLSMVHGEDVATVSYAGYADLVLDFGYDPDISTLSPNEGATGVGLNPTLVATFNEPVQAGSGFITIRKDSDSSIVEVFDVADPAQVSFNGSAITFNPSLPLLLDTTYYVTIDPTAVEDLSGNSYAGLSLATDWNFSTLSENTIAIINTGSTSVTQKQSNSKTSFSFDAGSSAEMLIVAISTERSTERTYTVSYNGFPMTKAVESVHAGIWYIDLTETSYTGGASNILIDFTGVLTVNGVGISAVSISGGGNSIMLHSHATSANGADEITLTNTRDDALNVVSFNANEGSGAPSILAPLDTIYASANIGSAQGAAGYANGVDAGDHTYSWSANNSRKVVAASFVINSFSNWLTTYDLGGFTGLIDDFDGDKVPNAIEAWFGTNPSEFSPGLIMVQSNGASLELIHPQSDFPPSNLQINYKWSKNLVDWYECDGVDGPAVGENMSLVPETLNGLTTLTASPSVPMDRVFIKAIVSERP